MLKFDKKNDKAVYEQGVNPKRFVRKKDFKDQEFLDRMREIKMVKQDPEWYYTNEDLTAPFAKIPFNRILGVSNKAYPYTQVPSAADPSQNLDVKATKYTAPGIMCVNFIPTMGYSDKPSSPLNVAANKNFAFMRRENAGSTNYTDSDLMMYYLSVVGLVPAIKHAVRALKISAVYASTSRYLPDLLVKSMGFEPVDMRKNYENYRGRVNRLIAKFNQFPVPADFKHIKRWEFLCDNVFMDRNSTKAQVYFYRPIAIPRFNELGDDKQEFGFVDYAYPWGMEASTIQPGIYQGKDITYMINMEAYLDIIDDALARLYNSSSIAIMAGDTMKAFSTTGVYNMSLVKEFDEIIPVYSEMGIRQFHNLEFLPIHHNGYDKWADVLRGFKITQTLSQDYVNFILQCKLIGPGSPSVMQKMSTAFLNIDKANPDWKDVIEITRTKMVGEFTTEHPTGGTWGISVHFASEIYVNAHVFVNAEIDDPKILITSFSGQVEVEPISYITAFDWAPIYFYVSEAGTASVRVLAGEVDNYTFLSGSDLSMLNEAIIQDLFGIS